MISHAEVLKLIGFLVGTVLIAVCGVGGHNQGLSSLPSQRHQAVWQASPEQQR